jgi:hypothetical protein
MSTAEAIATVRQKYQSLSPIMDEKLRRRWAATEALALGWGGISAVAEATGLSLNTVRMGIAESRSTEVDPDDPANDPRIRRPGGGRKRLARRDRTLLTDLEALVNPSTRGDPQSPLRWTSKSTRSHPDRDAQFEYIAKQVRGFQRRGQPVVSVDTKKKELVGDFKNAGREWQPEGSPEEVRCKDFKDKALGKVAPYGVYDQTNDEGWVSVGIDHDTAEFATETLRRWWSHMGIRVYPRAKGLLVTADGGGSNSSRSRLWKVALQGLADEIGLRITVCHFPPGTSKWNKIEHRMFCHITENWRGRPLISRAVVVNLIGNTKTKTGLRINAELDSNTYKTGLKVTDEELATINLKRCDFHGDWNYTISPRQ